MVVVMAREASAQGFGVVNLVCAPCRYGMTSSAIIGCLEVSAALAFCRRVVVVMAG
jgi:hypothetical protein